MKPILFNTEMVRAILEGRKTVTRRVIKGVRSRFHIFHFLDLETDPDICSVNRWGEEVPKTVKGLFAEFEADDSYPIDFPMFKSPYQVGDILYVRETWGDYRECSDDGVGVYAVYRADYPDGAKQVTHPDGIVYDLPKWHPSIHMPKEAARIFLKVTDVRVERLQDISADEIRKEGLTSMAVHCGDMEIASKEFALLWNSTIKKQDLDHYDWKANPWVWVIEFERFEKGGAE